MEVFGICSRKIPEKGMKGSKTNVASADSIVTTAFQMIKKGNDFGLSYLLDLKT